MKLRDERDLNNGILIGSCIFYLLNKNVKK